MAIHADLDPFDDPLIRGLKQKKTQYDVTIYY